MISTPTARRNRNGPGGLVLAFAAGLVLVAVGMAGPAAAQSLTLDLGVDGGSTTNTIVQIVALVTILSLAPSILVMVTSFTRIVVVLSFLRTALGAQQTPPNSVLISLALFLTAFIMAPVFQEAWDLGIFPLIDNQIDESMAFERTVQPFSQFMLAHTRE